MKIVLTVVLAAIFLAAVWSGYRRGLILSAAQLAAIVAALAMRDEQDITLRAAMTQVYCARLCYVLVTSVGFLLILLILAAIGNLPNLAFQLPNREKLNDIGGAAFGAVNGVCFGILLCWALQFAGPVIGRDTLAHTALAKALQAIDVLTLGVGV